MRHLSAAAVLLVLVSIVTVHPVSPGIALGPFLGYHAKATKKTAKFVKVPGVHLADAFEDGSFDLTAAADFLVATAAPGVTDVTSRTHLRAYKIKAAKGSPKHVKQLGVPVADAIGTLRIVNTTKPELLLVPTAANPAVVPETPDPSDLDPYKCYRVAIAKKTPKLPKGLQTTANDPFTGVVKTFDVKALRHLCLPVDDDGAGIQNPSLELACYAIAAAKGQPKAAPEHALQLNNALGALTVDTAKESELCVAAEHPAATPTPGASGAVATPTRTGTASGPATPTPLATSVPADPAAPPVANGVVSIPALATTFLYTGANPIQTGVAPDAIDPMRGAVLRGRVLRPNGDPLPSVTVDVHDHPELGSTRTRTDGRFDLVVNGGGPLTVRFRADGLIAVARTLDVPWQQFVIVPDVVMTALDPQVTGITFGPTAPFQTASSTMQSDADGARHTLLLFPSATSASLVFSDGSIQPASTLHIRATELTVGGSGPAAMPAGLPALSGYTYCTELSADEAIAAGAVSVAFTQPVIAYTENFLDFPVGLPVPLGFFDRQRAVWVAQPNGRIVKITAVNGGVADVDTDGDGTADGGLGISMAERQALGAAYPAGTSLWRMPTTHFTPIDGNNNIDTSGDTPPAQNGAGPSQNDPIQKPCQNGGSIIECENQVLGESLAVIGTPYTLDYRSDRVPAQSATKTIQLSGASVPPTLAAIGLHLSVAGRSFDQSFAPSANLATTFTWDRMDAYGRQLVGGQTLAVTIDYTYPAAYQEPGPFPEAFNQVGGTTLALNPSRQQVSISDHFTTTIGEGLTDARTIGLGGWSLDVHHVYDPVARVLHTGGGARRRAGSLARLLSTIPLPGKSQLFDVATGPDGSVYVALPHGDQIIRIASDGTQTVIAGNGTEGFSGDGGPATAAELGDPTGVAVAPDGSILIAEEANRRVRRVAPDGTITTIAGGNAGFSGGDGGPATDATFTFAERLSVGPDGSIYVVDGGIRIRRITTDGKIQTVAGTGTPGGAGDNGPATAAEINCASVSAASDGGFFIADFFNHRVRRVRPDGIITTVVDYTSDVGEPVSVRPAPDGALLIAVDYATARTPQIDMLKADGTLVTIAGGGPTPVANGVPATQANLAAIRATALGPDGSLYLVRGASNDGLVVKIGPAFPGFTGDGIVIASEDGTELYVFDRDGRHRQTLLALTGAVLREFGYDTAGRLTSISEKTGAANDVTTIQHDANGNATAIVGPFGQTTTLAVDANGFLASVTNPAGEARTLTSSADGLLATLTNPRGKTTTFTYDGDSRLLTDADPIGGSQTLARTSTLDAFTVTRTTALGHATSHHVANLPADVQERTITDPDGATHQSTEQIDAGTVHVVFPDGSTSDTTLAPDPRFGMQAPITASSVLHFPTSPSSAVTSTRSATLANPQDPLSLTSQTSTVTFDGDATTTVYDAATNTFSATSAAGRTSTLTIDPLGRFVSSQIGSIAPKHATYDAHGRLATLTSGSGGTARTLTYGYDAAGFLTSITDPVGRTSTLAYDLAGRVTAATLPNGKVVAYGYDAAGNLTSVRPPGRPAHGLARSDRNELTLVTPPTIPGTGTLAFAYDVDQALTAITRSGTDGMTIGYDGFGRPASRTQNLGGPPIVDAFGYDAEGRLSHVASTNGVAIDYAYDGLLSVGETLSGPVAGSVTRTYDGALRIASQTVTGTSPITNAYDADGKLTSAGALDLVYDANGLVTDESLGVVADTATYDAFGDLASRTVTANGVTVYAETLTRDADARITQKVETIGGAASTYVYAYDLAGQLTGVTKDGASVESYAYDDNGNRTDATVGGVHVTASTDAQDRLTQYGTTAFAYTPAGDLESRTVGGAVTTYEYDVLGNLLALTLPDATAITYLVDGQGRRVGKKVNGTLVQGFLYDDVLRPVAELDGGGAIVSRFVYSGGTVPAYLVKGGTAFRVISDTIGSVRLVVNASTGAVAQRLDYDGFGRVTQDTNPGFQPFGFAGGIYDPDTTLVRFGVRDYDAAIGRWTAKDQAGFGGGDPNLYRYVLNDPVNLGDPTGLDWLDTLTGFSDRLRADTNLATNPILLVDVTVDALVRATVGFFGGDPGETLYSQLFTTHSSLVDTKSGDYLDGQFYGQCVDLALAVVDAAGMGISSAAGAADRALAQRAARLADEAAEKAAAEASRGSERAIDRLSRNLRDINVERVRAENGIGNTTRGRNLGGGYLTGR